MLKIIKISAVGVALGIGALAGAPAQADSFYMGAGNHGAGFGIVVSDHDGRWSDRDDWRSRDHDDWRWHHRPDYRPVRFCTAGRAVDKAARMGVRYARVNYENRSVIGVRGHDWRGRIQLTFGRAPNCPLIR
jgi:hypothetical protein